MEWLVAEPPYYLASHLIIMCVHVHACACLCMRVRAGVWACARLCVHARARACIGSQKTADYPYVKCTP